MTGLEAERKLSQIYTKTSIFVQFLYVTVTFDKVSCTDIYIYIYVCVCMYTIYTDRGVVC